MTVLTLKRRARAIVAVLGATVALVTAIAPVAAAAPQQVTIVSHVTFVDGGPNYGDFVASGPAVDGGLICASGTFVDTGIRLAGLPSPRGGVQLQVVKQFTCEDGFDTFVVKLQIQADFNTGIESFNWVVLDGTGDYAALRGRGGGSTVPEPPTGNINTYEGFLLH
jgi:hypothetical protein